MQASTLEEQKNIEPRLVEAYQLSSAQIARGVQPTPIQDNESLLLYASSVNQFVVWQTETQSHPGLHGLLCRLIQGTTGGLSCSLRLAFPLRRAAFSKFSFLSFGILFQRKFLVYPHVYIIGETRFTSLVYEYICIIPLSPCRKSNTFLLRS